METYFGVQDHVIVTNPTSESFKWMVGGEREYTIEPGQTKRLHGSSAQLYVKKMTDLMLIQANRARDIRSEEARKEMSEKLIIKVVSEDENVDVGESVPTKEERREAGVKNDSAPVAAPSPEPEEESFPDIKKQVEAKKDQKSKPATKSK